jgi:hypothetical protein
MAFADPAIIVSHFRRVGSLHRSDRQQALQMRDWMSQIIIGVIVTVVGTVIANALIRGSGGKHFYGGSHFSGPARAGR